MAKTLIGDKEFPAFSSGQKLSFPDKKSSIFNFFWDSGPLAAGLTNISNANSLTIGNNFDLLIKKITVTCVRYSAAVTAQQSGEIALSITSSLPIGDKMNLSSIGAQWDSINSFIHNFTPGCPQLEVNGFKIAGGSTMIFNLQAHSFGATVLNDEVLAYFSLEY